MRRLPRLGFRLWFAVAAFALVIPEPAWPQVLDGWEAELRDQLWEDHSCAAEGVRPLRPAGARGGLVRAEVSCRDGRRFLARRDRPRDDFRITPCRTGVPCRR